MPPSVSTSVVRAAIMTVRAYGRVVLMGGVGMAGRPGPRAALSLDHAQLHLHSRRLDVSAGCGNVRLIALVRAGLLRLDQYETTAFDLDHVNEAVAHAAANGGPFKLTVIRP